MEGIIGLTTKATHMLAYMEIYDRIVSFSLEYFEVFGIESVFFRCIDINIYHIYEGSVLCLWENSEDL